MATVTFSIGTYSYQKTISAGDVARVTAAVKNRMGNEDATDQQAADYLAAEIWQWLKGGVRQYEDRVDTDIAVAANTDIDLT